MLWIVRNGKLLNAQIAPCIYILHVTWNLWNVIYNNSVANVWLEQHYQNMLLERDHTQSKVVFDWAPLSTEYVEVETVEWLYEFPVILAEP